MLTASAVGTFLFASAAWAEEPNDSLSLQEVVVTGARNATSVHHLPMTVTVIGREKLTEQQRTNVLPTVSELVPSLFVTSRGLMGYGVSNGAAGGINLRGINGGSGGLLLRASHFRQLSNADG